ncbi:MAG: phenylacetate-CoA oxygenase subunit PaaJ [Chitinophagaceae bacterium]|nr:phenylacetate-CoA oxygenase subunit PaaJ [Chitinophagaceae bacterium]
MIIADKEITVEDIRKMLSEVVDPEIPVVTIADLGILRDVRKEEGKFIVILTPTYSGCPATDMITLSVIKKLRDNKIENFHVVTQLSPAWTTDWMTDECKAKLKRFGIAPPEGSSATEVLEKKHPRCPHCHSMDTILVTAFGTTACKALFKCNDCREPFEYFKCH